MSLKSIKVITDALLVLPTGVVQHTLVIEGNRIVAITPEAPASLLLNQDDVEIISAKGCTVTPGLIDQHTHGAFGVNFNETRISDVQGLLAKLPSYGVTSIVPTVMSAPLEDMVSACNTLEEVIHLASPDRTRVVGLHLEGPFISPLRNGAHPPSALQSTLDAETLGLLISPNVKIITLAPELDPTGEAIAKLCGMGIRVSIGHSDATWEQSTRATDAGACGVTHLYNAMRPLNHREPGIVGAALNDDRLYVELIADGAHLHRVAIQTALRNKPADKVILITDGLALSGLPEGDSIMFGNQPVTQGQVSLGGMVGCCGINASGTLAGSTTFLDACVRNLVQWGCLRFDQAVRLATQNPAAYLGLSDVGQLKVGQLADIVLWDNATLQVKNTWIDGQLVYSKNGNPQQQAVGV
jgi:N-acetylglucosamine-6-phosphate deacetylase